MNNYPISAIKSDHKSGKRVSAKKKYSSTGRKKGRKKKRVSRNLPHWLVRGLALVLIVLFCVFFYHFFIRPYAYRWKPCYGNKEYGVCMPSGYQVHGIDISHYQGKIDWKKLAKYQSPDYPLLFVFIKATEGGSLCDKAFQKNFKSARQHGFIRGAYHYFNPETSAAKQAKLFIHWVKLDGKDLPPVLDVEKIGGQSKESLVKAVKIWLNMVEAYYGVKPIIYTSYKFKTKYLSDSLFNAYPYWIAHYYVDSVEYKGQWKFWQHTDVGSIPGVEENVDLNIFNGTLTELENMTIRKNISARMQ